MLQLIWWTQSWETCMAIPPAEQWIVIEFADHASPHCHIHVVHNPWSWCRQMRLLQRIDCSFELDLLQSSSFPSFAWPSVIIIIPRFKFSKNKNCSKSDLESFMGGIHRSTIHGAYIHSRWMLWVAAQTKPLCVIIMIYIIIILPKLRCILAKHLYPLTSSIRILDTNVYCTPRNISSVHILNNTDICRLGQQCLCNLAAQAAGPPVNDCGATAVSWHSMLCQHWSNTKTLVHNQDFARTLALSNQIENALRTHVQYVKQGSGCIKHMMEN